MGANRNPLVVGSSPTRPTNFNPARGRTPLWRLQFLSAFSRSAGNTAHQEGSERNGAGQSSEAASLTARPCGCQFGKNCPRRGRCSLSAPQGRQAWSQTTTCPVASRGFATTSGRQRRGFVRCTGCNTTPAPPTRSRRGTSHRRHNARMSAIRPITAARPGWHWRKPSA